MKINYPKAKEMLLGPLLKHNVPGLDIEHNLIERVLGFKLFGVHVTNHMLWNLHVDYICVRANTRLHICKRLKSAGLPADRLTHWFVSVIRPVLEYCAVVWHHGLSKHQTDLSKAVQRQHLSDYNVCALLGGTILFFCFRLFLSHAISSAVILFRKGMTYLVAITIYYHPRVTLNLPSGSEVLPCILDIITEPTVTNHSSTMLC